HVADDARAFAHPVVRPGEEPAHAVMALEGAGPALHRAVLGEPLPDQAVVVAGQEVGDVGFVIEGHSSSRITASAARLWPGSALIVLTVPAFWARRMFSIF